MNFVRSNLFPISILFFWTIVLYFISSTIRNYYSIGFPPEADNLAYQLEGIKIARSILEGNFAFLKSYLGDNIPILHVVTIGLGYLFFGFELYSPYIISALFALGNLILIYALSVELGAKKSISLVLTIFISTLPNFIYQNFLQTRNDFQLGFFIILFSYLLILSLKTQSVKLIFFAGIISGIGTLYKLSAPGYFIWIYFLFFVIPNAKNNFMTRLKCLFIASIGAILVSAWFYIPALSKILAYYSKWGAFSELQYGLDSPFSKSIFYFKNLIFTHLTLFRTLVILLIVLIGISFLLIGKNRNEKKKLFVQSFDNSYLLTIFLSYISIILFLTFKNTFSSAGDNPLLPIIFTLVIIILNSVMMNFSIHKLSYFICSLLLCINLFFSIKELNLVYKTKSNEFESYTERILNFKKKYGMLNENFIQVFSHPTYIHLANIWYLHLKNKVSFESLKNSQIDTLTWTELSINQKPEVSFDLIKKIPFIILPKSNPIQIGGEYYMQINIQNKEILKLILDSNLYDCKEEMNLFNDFTVEFCIHKNYSKAEFLNVTKDGWVEWETEFQYFANSKYKFNLSAKPLKDTKSIYLFNPMNKEKYAGKFLNIDNSGKYFYQFELPQTEKLMKLKLMTIEEKNLPISLDPRQLAFREIILEKVKN